MIRNRMPLRHLLLLALIALIFFLGCMGYALSNDNYQTNETRWIMNGCGISVIILSIVGLGIWMKNNKARMVLLIFVYLLVIGWTVLAGLWFVNMGSEGWKFRLMPLIFSIGMYSVLFSFISFINNSKLIEEFELKDEEY